MYALAIVLFLITAVSFAIVTEQDGRSLYVVSTVVLGLLLASVGYYLRPKVKAVTAYPTTASMPQEAVSPTVPQAAATMEVPIAEAPKVEVPLVVEAPKVEAPTVEIPVVTEAPSTAQITTPTVEAIAVELTQIRGINENRAVQLKANGINSVKDLAEASASDLATKLNVSPKIVKMWIGSAKKRVK
jgi:predicted flap endonuclease-1-like 5' DNA nuclease